MSVDPRATRGFAAAEAYDRGRPPFPATAVATLVGELGLTRAGKVLDLGAGSRLFTEVLVPVVGEVIAVEPSEAMLGSLRRRLPTVDAKVGSAEAIPLPHDSVQAVFVAQAFHWFRTGEAAVEIARVLKPAGYLVLVEHRHEWWNRGELPWIAEFDRLLEPFWEASVARAGAHPNVGKHWKTDLERLELFEPFCASECAFVHELSGEDFVALVASWSWIAILSLEQRQRLVARPRSDRERLAAGVGVHHRVSAREAPLN